jgi:AraC-like DNA-binding protein
MSTPVPMMRVSGIFELIRWLTENGRSVEPFLEASGLAAFNVSDPNNVIPLFPASEFCKLVMRQEGPDIGARIVDPSTIFRIGGAGQVLLRGPTIRIGVINLAIGFARQATHAHLTVTPGDDELVVRHFYSVRLNAEFIHFSQQFIAALFKALLVSAGAVEPQVERVLITPHPKQGLEHLKPYFGSALRPSTTDSLVMKVRKSIVDRRVRTETGAAADHFRPTNWASLRGVGTLAYSVRVILRELLSDGEPSIGQVAAIAGLTVRTFQRRLMQEGVSYAELLDQVRKDVVIGMLDSGVRQISETTHAAAYTAGSSVTRAVRRWTGAAPRTLVKKRDRTSSSPE